MAAFWLVVTQHCGLEAAGILGHGCEQGDGSHSCDTPDHTDGCQLVEGGSYKTSSGTLKISGPQLVVCLWLIRTAEREVVRKVPASCREYAERPRDWVPSWRFAQRTALAPRAPSLA